MEERGGDVTVEELEADMDRLRAETAKIDSWMASRARRIFQELAASEPVRRAADIVKARKQLALFLVAWLSLLAFATWLMSFL